MSLRLAEIGYAAGFYEGEGSFVANPDGTGQHLSITQKDPEPLLRLQKTFGGEVRLYGGYHYWRVFGTECRGFILTIFSLLSDRRRKQILKHKTFFTTPDCCPNGHQYINGSYDMVDDPRGRSYKSCLVCRKEKRGRFVDPINQAALLLVKTQGITKEEAIQRLKELGVH